MTDVLNQSFDDLRSLFAEVLAIKNSPGDRTNELAEKRKYAALLFVMIKKINRLVKYKVRAGREELHGEKLRVDSNRLQLQNLLYEVTHLKREIRRCHQFKSQDEEIDLLPEAEYFADLEEVPTSPHERRLARLGCELNLRKQLSTQSTELCNSKKQVLQDIVLKMERLTSFAPSLRTLLKATRPLQDALQVPIDREWKLAQLVQLLPQPLYLVYMNVNAMQMAGMMDVSVTIFGSEEDVHSAEIASQMELLKSVSGSSDTDEMEPANGRMRRSYTESAQKMAENIVQQVMTPHPLQVRFSIGDETRTDECIVVNLRYFQRLGFATATTEINQSDTEGIAGEVALLKDILKYLYDDDFGESVPLAAAEYKLKKYNLTVDECSEYLQRNELGRPYRWLQRMCCVETERGATVKLQKFIPETVRRIRDLWSARLNLMKQLKALINKNIDLYLKDEKLPEGKPSCSLVQWTSLTWDEYVADSATAEYLRLGMVDCHQVFYRAVIVRGSAKMQCLISISSKFPMDSPLWVISLYWNGQHNSTNNSAIKSMEYWTNCLQQRQLKNKHALLAAQLVRTMYSFDVFLETEGPLYNPVEYNKEKHYLKAFTKRMRARPYKYLSSGSVQLFKQ